MAHDRRFRFGVDVQAPFDGLSWAETSREVEELGYATLFVPDHFDEGLGPIAALAAAAAATSTLRVGTLVIDCDFRHPAVLARELATVDVLSGGRLEVGVGAGWKRLDYERSGIAMDPPGTRVDRMIEHVHVLRGLFFAGAHAHIVGVNASIHSGEIDVAAAHDGLPARIDEKVAWVREAAGARFDDLELNAWLAVAEVTDDAGAFAEALGAAFDADPKDVLASPLTLVGSAREIAERLHERRERWGYSYVVVPGDKAHDFAPIVRELTGR